jgi:hypothetical protein
MVVQQILRGLTQLTWENENEHRLTDGDIMWQLKKEHEDIMLV